MIVGTSFFCWSWEIRPDNHEEYSKNYVEREELLISFVPVVLLHIFMLSAELHGEIGDGFTAYLLAVNERRGMEISVEITSETPNEWK